MTSFRGFYPMLALSMIIYASIRRKKKDRNTFIFEDESSLNFTLVHDCQFFVQ